MSQCGTQSKELTDVVSSENDPGVLDDNLQRKAVARQPAVVLADQAHENPPDSTLGTRKRARLADLINNNNITVGKDERGAPCSYSETRRLPGPAGAQLKKDATDTLAQPGTSRGTPASPAGAQLKKDATDTFAQPGTSRGTPASPGSAQEQTTRGGAQNPKEDEDSGSETDDTEPLILEEEDQEPVMKEKIEHFVGYLPSNSMEVQLIRDAMAAGNKGMMRRFLLKLCVRLAAKARDLQDYQATISLAVNERRKMERALLYTNRELRKTERELSRTENQSNQLHFSLQMERKKNRRLCIGVQKYVRMEEAGRFTLTNAEQEELRRVKEMVDSDDDFPMGD